MTTSHNAPRTGRLNWKMTASVCRPGKFFYSSYPWAVTNSWTTGLWHGKHPVLGETVSCQTAEQAMAICEARSAIAKATGRGA